MAASKQADAAKLTQRVARLHRDSVSPTGKFGFHVPTCQGNIPQSTGWEESWTVMFTKILSRAMGLDLDLAKSGPWPEFSALRHLLVGHVIPRLLDALCRDGRSIKPCLVHGDLWDENCADDASTGLPFAFDAGALYAHNEYEIGNWRARRHRLSRDVYVQSYKTHFPASEPADEWDARNRLCSIRYNVSCAVMVPNSGQRQVGFEDTKTLCRQFFPQELGEIELCFG